MRRVRCVDLFCGVGGFANGLRRTADTLGLEVEHLAAVDTDRDALGIYYLNHRPQRAYAAPVEAWHERIKRWDKPPTCDLLVAGPPCQGHSKLNIHSQGNDPRNALYMTTVEVALTLRAAAIVIENVPGVVRDEGQVFQRAESELARAGYFVTAGLLHAARMGAPQKRTRHFLIARRDHWPHGVDEIERYFAAPPQTAAEVLAGPMSTDPRLTKLRQVNAENQRRIAWLFENDAYELPNELRPPSQRAGSYRGSYNRVRPTQIAPTITTKAGPGNGRLIHPTEERMLTDAEVAAIQEFPPDYDWGGDRQHWQNVYGRIRPDRPAPTLTTRAGMASGRFVHTDEPRVINDAEAAAIQEIPADYQWGATEPSADQLRTWIGNAVPATLAHAATWAALA